MYDLSLYAGSPVGSPAAHAVPGSGSTPDVLSVYREREHYGAFADCGVKLIFPDPDCDLMTF